MSNSDQKLPYYLAVRFQGNSTSEEIYTQTQEIIRDNECDLSTYRFLRQHVLILPWYIIVIGEWPPEEIHQQLTTVLQLGAPAIIPPETLAQLVARRGQKTQEGPWVEHHHTIKMRKGKTGGKSKRNKQHKKGRR